MKRFFERKRNWKRRAAALFLAAAVSVGSVNSTSYACTIHTGRIRSADSSPLMRGNAAAAQTQAAVEKQTDQVAISGDGYQVTVKPQNIWDEGCQAEIEVKNTGTHKLRNWDIQMSLARGTVKKAWNITWQEEENRHLFSSQEHNRIIEPGTSVIFGCQLEGAVPEDVQTLEFRQRTREIRENKEYEVVYTLVNQWEGHASVEAEIHNRTQEPMEDWQLSVDFEGEITSIWNADVISHDGKRYELGNKDYNAVIPARGSTKFGFEADYGTNPVVIPKTVAMESAGEGMAAATARPTTRPTMRPTEAPTKQPTEQPVKSPEPVQSEQPGTDTASADEEFDPEEDVWVYHDVENRDWNMEMIHADSAVVKGEREKERGAVRVALLDSGVNYSDEVFVSERKNFVPGQDDYSELYEDVSGHGTAVAEVLASNPNGKKVPVDVEAGDGRNEYIYYDEAGNEVPTEEEEEEEPLDTRGSILELLESGYAWNEGVNPGVDLISAKVLDENNETTVERVVEAIDWAIEKKADILSMSFGMKQDSEKLHKAVCRAYDAGLLLIAAAGNEGEVEYPAAYPEVMAVGSVDSLAEQAEQSAEGEEVEVVAPGEFIVSRGAFDSMQIFSGTSMAVPHVTGLASILWEKDTAKPADFVRQLIDATARECGEAKECGYGLIDCEYAVQHYDEYAGAYQGKPKEIADGGEPVVQMENTEEIDTDEEVRELYGRWDKKKHRKFVSSYAEKNGWVGLGSEIDVLKNAVVFVDDEDKNPKCQGMHLHPWFHGYYGKEEFEGKPTDLSNYMASYYYLYCLAKKMYETGKVVCADTDTPLFRDEDSQELKNAYKGINQALAADGKVGSQTWKEICGVDKVTKEDRSLVLFGMALHTLTDTYAHSSFKIKKKKTDKGKLKLKSVALTHSDAAKKEKRFADNTAHVEKRFTDAKKAATRLMSKIKIGQDVFQGFKPAEETLMVYLGQKRSPQLQNFAEQRKASVISDVEKEYLLGSADRYAGQMQKLCGSGMKQVETFRKKMKTVDKENFANIVKNYNLMTGRKNKKTKKTRTTNKGLRAIGTAEKVTYHLYDMDTGNKMLTVCSEDTPYVLAVAKDSRCKMVAVRGNGEKKLCYVVRGGMIYDAIGGEVPETLWEDTGEEPEEEEAELGDIFSFEYDWYDVSYRVEMTWENETVDLDLLLMAMFPDEDNFYLTCIRDKTAHPELGDVFQSDPDRASLDRDVKDASGAETITIHNVEVGGMYLFLVRNFDERSTKQLMQSGATLRVYRGHEMKPFYTVRVPEGKGYYWNAFCLMGDTGELLPIDTITYEAME